MSVESEEEEEDLFQLYLKNDDSDSDYEVEFGGDFKLLGNLIRHKSKVSTYEAHVDKSSSESGSESDEEEKSNEERYFEDLVLEKISE